MLYSPLSQPVRAKLFAPIKSLCTQKTNTRMAQAWADTYVSHGSKAIASSAAIAVPPGFRAAAPAPASKRPAGKASSPAAAAAATPETTARERDDIMVKKAWEMAIAPAKQLPMTAFMMYMAGNSLQIFSVTMTGMALLGPIKALSQLVQGRVFNALETSGTQSRLMTPKLVFGVLQIVALLLGVLKMQWMGLLPTTRSDWLAWEPRAEPEVLVQWQN